MRVIRVVTVVMGLCATAYAQAPDPAQPVDPAAPPADAPPAEPPPAEPPPSPGQAAFEEGRALLEAGKHAEACAKFDESIRADPDAPGTMLNLGLCNAKLGKTATALHWFRKAQFRGAEQLLGDVERAAKQNTVELATKVPYIKIELAHPAPGATHSLDGTQLSELDLAKYELDPGAHTLETRIPNKPSIETKFTIVDGENKVVTVAVPGPIKKVTIVDRGATRRKLAYALGGLGIGLVGGSVALSLVAKNNYDEADEPHQWQRWQDIARYGGTSMFIVGGAAIAGATLLYLRAPGEERIEQTVTAAPVVGPNQLGVAVHGAF